LEINGLKEYVNQKQDILRVESENLTKKITLLQSLSQDYQKFVTKEQELNKLEKDIKK
jgi:hypothetical protein